jgi:hypothetical protein
LVPFLVPVAVMGLHTFVSLLQAFIFMLLTMALRRRSDRARRALIFTGFMPPAA